MEVDTTTETIVEQPPKNATQIAKEHLYHVSKFAYYDKIEFALAKNSKVVSHDDTERAVLLGDIAVSDYFVLRAVAKFSWANCEMVTTEIGYCKSKEPEKAYPVAKHETIKACLSRLSKNGLLRGFEYTSFHGVNVKVYCATESGIYFLKKKLYYDGPIETFNSLNPPEEAFKRLASNYVAQKLSKYKGVTKFIPGTWLYLEKVGKEFVYSQLVSEVNGIEHLVIVEPYYIRSNPMITSKEEMMYTNERRRDIIKGLIEKQENKRIVSIVVVVEDVEGLKNAANYYFREFGDMIHNVYFTSENLVYMSKDITSAFLQAKEKEDGKYEVKVTKRLDFINYEE